MYVCKFSIQLNSRINSIKAECSGCPRRDICARLQLASSPIVKWSQALLSALGFIGPGSVLQRAVQQDAVQQGAVQQGAVHQGAVPQDAVQQGALQQGAVNQGAVQQGEVQQVVVQ